MGMGRPPWKNREHERRRWPSSSPDYPISTRRCSSISDDARAKIAAWVLDFNTARPHSALGYLTPAAYAANFTAKDDQLRSPDQLRRTHVAPTAPPKRIKPAEALIAAG